ncbi:putative signal transducing protein [Propylenella binzhouense]|uniref:DUF2007 domain-containing protein n=1 Tax=Propylenella binzhouense TaxID=2555902 RepID=A0A964WV43_9HYPH|nr:DUF2007 domain-containing protein [Propylenella binzhouense]
MNELLRSNDPVLISFVETLLRDAGIEHLVVDWNTSVVEGSLGILPRRVLVPSRDLTSARRLMEEAGLGTELSGLPK